MNKGIFIIELFDNGMEYTRGYINSSYGTMGDITRAKPFFYETAEDITKILNEYSKLLEKVMSARHHGPLASVYTAIRDKFYQYDSIEDFELISQIQQEPKAIT